MATVAKDLEQHTAPPPTLVSTDGYAPESFEQVFQAWNDWMLYRELSPNTIRLYSRCIEKVYGDLGDFRDAETETLDGWVQGQRGQAGTKGNRICALTSFFRFMAKTKRRADNPALELERPKQHKRMPKPVEDIEKTLAAMDRADEKAKSSGPKERRVGETRDMAVFLGYTGLRIHEAVKCAWPVPCPDEAFVIGKGNKEELMLIPDKARDAWNRLGGAWPLTARATQRRFEKVGVTPHQFRHWRATSLVRAGVEIGTVSKIMRHSSVQTTMGYSSYAKQQFRDALGKVE